MTLLTTRIRHDIKRNKTLTAKEMWLQFPDNDKISLKDYKKVVKLFNVKLAQAMVETGDIYRLPSGAGLMSVLKRVTRKESLNFNLFRHTGEKVYYNNLHSDGYAARFVWKVREVSEIETGMHLLLKFKPAKPIKGILHKAIIEDNAINKYYDNF